MSYNPVWIQLQNDARHVWIQSQLVSFILTSSETNQLDIAKYAPTERESQMQELHAPNYQKPMGILH